MFFPLTYFIRKRSVCSVEAHGVMLRCGSIPNYQMQEELAPVHLAIKVLSTRHEFK